MTDRIREGKVVGMKKMLIVVVAGIVGASSLAGCTESEPEDKGVDTGVVIKSSSRTVVVLEDDGETDKHRVSRQIRKRCSVGERWPDCRTS